MPDDVSLAPAGPDDEEFLFRVYAATRQSEMELLPHWSTQQKQAFLAMQSEAQHRHYRAYYPGATYQVIRRNGVSVGRLYLDRGADAFLVLDIALLPEHRGAGIGSLLMRHVIEEAAAAGKPVRIHVERHNRALDWYRRLGFVPVEDVGVYWLMERTATAARAAAAVPSSGQSL